MISIVPAGAVPAADCGELAQELRQILREEIDVLEPVAFPMVNDFSIKSEIKSRGLDVAGERQYHVAPLMELARKFAYGTSDEKNRVLVVTDVDLYTDGLNFIFGQAEISGWAAVISIPRLKYHKYWIAGRRRTEHRKIYIERLIKEAVHELGHTFGLRHCSDRLCVMRFSNTLEDTDTKGIDYCTDCRQKLK